MAVEVLFHYGSRHDGDRLDFCSDECHKAYMFDMWNQGLDKDSIISYVEKS